LFVIGIAIILLALGSILGRFIFLSDMTTTERGSLLLVVATLYFIVLLILSAIQLWRIRNEANQKSRAGEAQDSLTDKCNALAERFKLSQRESEVLHYVCRGYNSPYIAQALFISDNTVRSHIKNIHRKLKVSSKMEILALFEAEPPAGTVVAAAVTADIGQSAPVEPAPEVTTEK
jgi:DNA-binding CsgD family transcriptional regulator